MHPQASRRSSWLGEALAAATVLSGVGYLVTAYTISRWLTRPAPGAPRPTPGQPCSALGISMGAAALCFAAERARTLNACVLESLYHDLASAFDNRIGTRFPAWFRRFVRGVVWVTERRLGLRLAQITPADHV